MGCNQWRHNERPCTPASGWEKGQLENQVGLVRERFFTPRLRVKSFDELNAWLLDKCVAHAKAHRHPEQADRTIWEVFEEERQHLVPYAGHFDGFHSVTAHSTIVLEPMANKVSYSPPQSAVPWRCMPMRSGSSFAKTGSSSANMRAPLAAARLSMIHEHYVPVLARKPGALRNGAPFKDWVLPPAMAAIRHKLKGRDDGDRQMGQILSCVPDNGLQAVEAACSE